MIEEIGEINVTEKIDAFEKEYELKKDFYIKSAKTLKNLVVNLIGQKFEKSNVVYRIKDKTSCIDKIDRKYTKIIQNYSDKNITDLLTDLIGVRIVCMYESEIQQIAELLEPEFEIIDKTDKTKELLENDNAFGYKGLHLDLKLNKIRSDLSEYSAYKDLRFEIQIRTIIQNAWSELDHQIKYKKHIPKELGRRINRLAALFEIADTEFESIDNVSKELQNKANQISSSVAQKSQETSTSECKIVIESQERIKLDIFSFVALLTEFFDDVYKSWAVESLLDDILENDGKYTFTIALQALKDNLPIVKTYVESNRLKPSFLTQVRYAIYLSDQEKFKSLLYSDLKKQLDAWLAIQNSIEE
ncbi:MAG: hypothetical protein NTY39_08775 [Campylobacterales bacterium]|nr:hypothetical protein [Campylobacterales bacterium]